MSKKVYIYGMAILQKIIKFGLLILIAILIIHAVLNQAYSPVKANFGVTFSYKFAKYLKLDYQKTYLQILDDLKVKNLRIPTYWDVLESQKGEYDFSPTDFLLDEAGKRGAKVILVLGVRQPRWPECHVPKWAKDLSVAQRQQEILAFVGQVVERYRDHPEIWAWQVENEPLLGVFGQCDDPDKNFLKQEVDLVRSLSSKTIIMTDSGELGFWATSMQLSDIFGTTLYRQVYDKTLGYVTYPLPPVFYSLKSDIVRNFFAPQNAKTIVVELQAEPWLADGKFLEAGEQAELFPVKNLQSYINFAQKTGFDEIYLWGVEWWYFMAENGHPEYLEYTKTLFK